MGLGTSLAGGASLTAGFLAGRHLMRKRLGLTSTSSTNSSPKAAGYFADLRENLAKEATAAAVPAAIQFIGYKAYKKLQARKQERAQRRMLEARLRHRLRRTGKVKKSRDDQ